MMVNVGDGGSDCCGDGNGDGHMRWIPTASNTTALLG